MGDLHVDTGMKRPRSGSSTPSPTVSRTRKTDKFDILQQHLDLDDSTMDQNTIQQRIHASMKNSLGPGSQAVSNTAAVTPGWEFGHGDQTILTKSKKNIQNSQIINKVAPQGTLRHRLWQMTQSSVLKLQIRWLLDYCPNCPKLSLQP